MIAMSFLKIYGLMNLLLVLGYLLFAGLKTISAKGRIGVDSRYWIKTGQALIVLAILAPLLFQMMPTQSLPEVKWGAFQPVSERIFSTPLIKLKKPRPAPATSDAPAQIPAAAIHLDLNLAASLLVSILVLGFVGMLSRLILDSFRLHRLIRESLVIRSLGLVRVALSESTTIPFSVRLLRQSWVVLPLSLLENNHDFKIALKHELQHHRQGDTLWAVAIELLLCGFFPNPAIYFWKREITELQEFSCDEALIGRKGISSHDYGSCLLRVAEAALGSRKMYVGTTCMATISKNPNYYKSFLRRRIEMFTSQERARRSLWAGALTGTIAITLTVAAAYGADQALRDKPQEGVNPGTVTVDPAIQAIAEKALKKALASENAKSGFAIVADPNTGQILAVANIDTTNKLTGYWALSQVMEPASLTKTLVIAQAIENGKTTPQEKHNCENGTYTFGKRKYHDYKEGGWDKLTTEETLANSSDICSIKIGEKVGVEGLRKMLVDYGIGPNGTAKSFPAAKSGTLPPADDLQHPRLIPHVSAGFGFHVTPLEMLQAYGAIANGGNLMMPQLKSENSKGEIIKRVLSAENSEKMKAILQSVVMKGTAKQAISDLYTTAGKTATSYVPDLTQWELVEGRKKGNFAGFVGFAPVKDPKVEIYVGIRDPEDKTGAHGNKHAAPVFKRIAEDVLTHMKVAPDKTKL